MCEPFTHKSVRQLPPGQLEILNKDGGPNSADGRVLYVNVHLLDVFSLRFFKSYREIDTVLSDNTVIVTSNNG